MLHQTTTEQVAMWLAESLPVLSNWPIEETRKVYANALCHAPGLKEMVEALEKGRDHASWTTDVTCFEIGSDCRCALAAALRKNSNDPDSR